MKVLVLGGFLGSGKTTVLMQLAHYLVNHAEGGGTPVVIVENEIGKNGVDNELLARNNFAVENIFSGCACCTNVGQLYDTVQQLESLYKPEWLIIEASGVAYPDNIRKTLKDTLDIDASILALVDVRRWSRVMRAMEQFVVAQLSGADVVLLTKVDLVENSVVEYVRTEVEKYAATEQVYPVCALEPQGDPFWEKVSRRLSMGGNSDGA